MHNVAPVTGAHSGCILGSPWIIQTIVDGIHTWFEILYIPNGKIPKMACFNSLPVHFSITTIHTNFNISFFLYGYESLRKGSFTGAHAKHQVLISFQFIYWLPLRHVTTSKRHDFHGSCSLSSSTIETPKPLLGKLLKGSLRCNIFQKSLGTQFLRKASWNLYCIYLNIYKNPF